MRSEGERRLSGKLPMSKGGASVGAPVESSVRAADRRVESDSDERDGPMNDSESGRSSPPEARASVGVRSEGERRLSSKLPLREDSEELDGVVPGPHGVKGVAGFRNPSRTPWGVLG